MPKARKTVSLSRTTFTTAGDDVSVTSVVSRMIRFAIFVALALLVIAPAHAERVFVIFQRLHPRDAYPGTGIGLALCRKIVDFHGGHIGVDTAGHPGSGTTIRWTLPGADGREEAN